MKTIVTKIPTRKAFLKGEKSLEIGYPWLSFGAIIALEAIVNKNIKVLEFGSGGSTIFWATSCSSVRSFETNPEWLKKVKKRVSKFDNVEIILADEKQTLEAISNEPDSYYDLVLVDSYPGDIRRILVANAVLPKIKKGSYLVIDNYLKFGMENFKYPKGEIYTFDQLHYSGRGTRICKLNGF
jgi:predicted O-methyltransferase YrrM